MSSPTRNTNDTSRILMTDRNGDSGRLPRLPDKIFGAFNRPIRAPNPPKWITKRHQMSKVDGVEQVPDRWLNIRKPPVRTHESLREDELVASTRNPQLYLYLPEMIILGLMYVILAGKLPVPDFPWQHIPGRLWSVCLLVLLAVEVYLSWWARVYCFSRTAVSGYSGWYTSDMTFHIEREHMNGLDVSIRHPQNICGERGLNFATLVIKRTLIEDPNANIGPVLNYRRIEALIRAIQKPPAEETDAIGLDLAREQLEATRESNRLQKRAIELQDEANNLLYQILQQLPRLTPPVQRPLGAPNDSDRPEPPPDPSGPPTKSFGI